MSDDDVHFKVVGVLTAHHKKGCKFCYLWAAFPLDANSEANIQKSC